jgi:predicted kinase
MNRKIYILIGLIASGKSTWAKQFVKDHKDTYRVSRDDLRFTTTSYNYTQKNEKIIDALYRNQIEYLLRNTKFDIILDEQNLNKSRTEEFKNWILTIDNNIQFIEKEFPITLEEAVQRDNRRDFKIGEKAITNTWIKYKNILEEMCKNRIAIKTDIEKIEYDINLQDCVICDVDGTLAIRGNRSPFDFSKVSEDKLNVPIKHLLIAIKQSRLNCSIFIFSGREDSCYDDTKKWLTKNSIHFANLFMRKTGNKRKDSIVKKELFEQYIKGNFNCLYWIDDRRQVIDMVRNELGICCLDVAGNNF